MKVSIHIQNDTMAWIYFHTCHHDSIYLISMACVLPASYLTPIGIDVFVIFKSRHCNAVCSTKVLQECL